MKKILSFTMVVLMLLSVCAFPAFAAENDELAQKFYDYCVENLPENMQPSEGDAVRIVDSVKISDGVEVFAGVCKWINTELKIVYKTIGNWRVCSPYTSYPYDLGVYVSSADEIFTLEEAYQKGVVTDLSPLERNFTEEISCVYVKEGYKYADYVLPSVMGNVITYYSEDFEYYSSENLATDDEATPDYVLLTVRTKMLIDGSVTHIFGDYIMREESEKIPYAFGKCIYIPSENKLYSLKEAYNNGVEGMENIFTEVGLGALLGDMDKDRKLTVKDATYIQKCLAGILEFAENDRLRGWTIPDVPDNKTPFYVSDFNRDGVRNIKDATAIQKKIAGLPY